MLGEMRATPEEMQTSRHFASSTGATRTFESEPFLVSRCEYLLIPISPGMTLFVYGGAGAAETHGRTTGASGLG
jgi:hypothetical protein